MLLLKQADVCKRLGISVATLNRWVADPEKHFPPCLKLGDGQRRWFPWMIAAWMVWSWKLAERRAKGEFPLPPAPDFESEMPTQSQIELMLVGEKLDQFAENTQSAEAHQQPEPTVEAIPQATA